MSAPPSSLRESDDAPPLTVAVSFALPDEGRVFVAALPGCRAARPGPLAPSMSDALPGGDGRRVIVGYSGVGADSACQRRMDDLLGADGSHGPKPALLISSGFAGGLRPDLQASDLVLADNFSDPALADAARRLLADEHAGRLHSGALSTQAQTVETAVAKRALFASTGAIAVDMETGWIAAAARRAGVPMLSLRVVSDAADLDFPVPGHVLFDALRQRPRYLALPAWLAAHPGQVAPFVRFVRGLTPARLRLASALQTLVARLPLPAAAR
jgi:hypothetical protein